MLFIYNIDHRLINILRTFVKYIFLVDEDVEFLQKKKNRNIPSFTKYIVVFPYMSCLCTEDVNIDVPRNYTHAHKIAHIDLRSKLRLMTNYKT
jgi:hypothetical protein